MRDKVKDKTKGKITGKFVKANAPRSTLKVTRYKRVPAGEARAQFSEYVSRASFGKERVIVTRAGKDLAALVPVEDLDLIEALQDLLDVKEAEKRLSSETPIPYSRVRKKLGLE